MRQKKAWEITDEFWEEVNGLLALPGRDPRKTYQRKPGGGRKPMDLRKALAGIFYALRTGCQWDALPREYGSPSAVHRYFQLWAERGVFLEMYYATVYAFYSRRYP
jgi:transposase